MGARVGGDAGARIVERWVERWGRSCPYPRSGSWWGLGGGSGGRPSQFLAKQLCFYEPRNVLISYYKYFSG